MCFRNFLKSPSRGRSREARKIKPYGEKTFLWHQNWCHRADLTFESGIKIDATRLKPAFVLAFWRQNGANWRCLLTSGAKTEPISCETSSHHPTATFEPPKRHWFWDFLKILFERSLCRQRETVLRSSFYPLTATWRAKKRHGFSKYLSTKLPKPAPLKKRHWFFAFLLRWSSVADSGVIFSALSSTPVPQHPKQKSKHCIETFSSTT